MKIRSLVILSLFCTVAASADEIKGRSIENPAIDMYGYLQVADQAADHRQSRRLTEEEFIRMSRKEGTVVLDARSRARFDELHVNGAINLSFPDITIESLERTIPDRSTRILIYCNNNFINAKAFPTKLPSASLNLATYIALFNYGYENVYELGPLLDVRTTKINLVASTRSAEGS